MERFVSNSGLPPRGVPNGNEGPDELTEDPPDASYKSEEFLFHLHRGSALLEDDQVAEAKGELELALSMQPRDMAGQGLLGVVYFRLGLYPRAIHIYEDLVHACPDEVTPRVNLALCYLKTGQSAAARDLLQTVIARVPDHRRAWAYLGLVFERLGELEKSLEAFERGGQPRMAQRIVRLLEDEQGQEFDSSPPKHRAELRKAAADAVAELDRTELLAPFSAAEDRMLQAGDFSGRWRTTEPGEERVPPPPRRSRPPRDTLTTARTEPERTEAVTSETSVIVDLQALLEQVSLDAAPPPAATLLSFPLKEPFVSRLSHLCAWVGKDNQLSIAEEKRRQRALELDEPLGGAEDPLFRLAGVVSLVLEPSFGARLTAVELKGEFLYVREEKLVGFQSSLRCETGRPTPLGRGATIVAQLSGEGLVVFESGQPLLALEVTAEQPLGVRARSLVAWTGRLLMRPASVEASGHGGLVSFSGDGAVLVEANRS